jgi:CubicO group peptidase (beta-lactamase class C family)
VRLDAGGTEPQFEPGTAFYYSDTSIVLLGMVIETATGMPLAEAYRTYIYEPLGMESTFLDCYEDQESRRRPRLQDFLHQVLPFCRWEITLWG